MKNFGIYDEIILDFDGVILDSNMIKENAVRKAASLYLDEAGCDEFTDYFVGNNGIPREIKIRKFFPEEASFIKVLDEYNSLLDKLLAEAKYTEGFEGFLNKLAYYGKKPHILSGGSREEIAGLLERRGIKDSFKSIMGGPLTKFENLDKAGIKGKVLYIGDSRIDYEVAVKYGFDFIFMYGYTQFSGWREFFSEIKNIKFIKNLNVFNICSC